MEPTAKFDFANSRDLGCTTWMFAMSRLNSRQYSHYLRNQAAHSLFILNLECVMRERSRDGEAER